MKKGSWSLKATPFRVVSWEVRRKDRLPGKDCLGFTEVVGTWVLSCSLDLSRTVCAKAPVGFAFSEAGPKGQRGGAKQRQ